MPVSHCWSISETANRPMSTGKSWKPLCIWLSRNSGTMRYSLLTENWFIMATSTPSIPIHRPRSIWPRDRAAMTVRAKRMMRNFSTAENLMAQPARMGVKRASTTREIMPPMKEEVTPIFRARSPSPRKAIGCPSKVVHTDDGVPGMLMRMAGTRPPEMPPT